VTDSRTFAVERATVRGVDIAYVREGAGGFPLVLLHGWPETKRIWWRNIHPLADAGFEVIAPDLRGFGDSGLAADGFYDTAANARDVEALVREQLGHERCVLCGGDYGGVIAYDLSLRAAGLAPRLVLFNTVPPFLGEAYEQAGLAPDAREESLEAADYFLRQGRDADGLAGELDTPQKRRRYVAGMYGHRFWAAPGAFKRDEVDFMTEPFGDADSFRASIALYEHALGAREPSETPRFLEPNPAPTLVLYGPEDHVIPRSFPRRMEVALPERIGPFVVEGAGHFLQWERAEVLNNALRYFCSDLLQSTTRR
jgi:pimeloyl-ACP methyl ester carboxylesterase